MKKLLFTLLTFSFQLSYGQIIYYTLNSDESLYSLEEVQSKYEIALKTLPNNYIISPTVYHKVVKNDTTINYIRFDAFKRDLNANKSEFKISFKQDSLFLLLNKKLPEFILRDLYDNEFSSSQLIGKPVLLNYWAIYCAPCIEEMPELNMLKEKYGDKMNFIALTENTCKDDDLIKFLEKHPFNYKILQNAENYKKTLKIYAIPINIFVDKDGYIRFIQGNFPYTAWDPQKGIKEFENNNYFVRIIERLTQKQ